MSEERHCRVRNLDHWNVWWTSRFLKPTCPMASDSTQQMLNPVKGCEIKKGTFSIRITENIWEKSSFRKTDHGLLRTPDLVYCFFEFISYTFQGENVKYINSGRISWLWNPMQTFEFPTILLWLPMMQLRAWTGLFKTDCRTLICLNYIFFGT